MSTHTWHVTCVPLLLHGVVVPLASLAHKTWNGDTYRGACGRPTNAVAAPCTDCAHGNLSPYVRSTAIAKYMPDAHQPQELGLERRLPPAWPQTQLQYMQHMCARRVLVSTPVDTSRTDHHGTCCQQLRPGLPGVALLVPPGSRPCLRLRTQPQGALAVQHKPGYTCVGGHTCHQLLRG